MVAYTGHFMTFVILSFCQFFSSYECKNEKRPTGCGVNFRLYQNMSNFMINYESVLARHLFWLKPEPDPSTLYFIPKRWHFCDKLKLSDSCRWKYEYTHGNKHLAFVCHLQSRYKYSIVTHKWTSLLNQTLLCSIDRYICPNILCQISFQTV